MSKASWYKELTMIILSQLYCYMLYVCRRTLADIHGYIKNCTLHASNELALGERWYLEMKTSHYTIRGHALIVLNKIDLANLLLKLTL